MKLLNGKILIYFIFIVSFAVAILVTTNFVKINSPKEFSTKEKQLLTSLVGEWYSERYNEKMNISVTGSDVIVTSNNGLATYKAENIDLDKNFARLKDKHGNHMNFTIINNFTIKVNGTAGNNSVGASQSTEWKKI